MNLKKLENTALLYVALTTAPIVIQSCDNATDRQIAAEGFQKNEIIVDERLPAEYNIEKIAKLPNVHYDSIVCENGYKIFSGEFDVYTNSPAGEDNPSKFHGMVTVKDTTQTLTDKLTK